MADYVGTLGTSGIQAGVNLVGNTIGSAINYGFQKKLMGVQKENQLELNKQAQDFSKYMTEHSAEMQVGSLMRAGLNPAMLQGSPTGNVATPGAGSAMGGTANAVNMLGNLDIADIRAKVAQANLLDAQAEGQKITNKYIDQQNMVEIALKASQIDVNSATVENFNHSYALIDAQRDLTQQQKENLKQEFKKLEEETRLIKVNADYADKLNDAQVQQYLAQAKKAIAEADNIELKNAMARLGIFVDGNWIGSLMAITQSGHGADIMDSLAQFLGSVLGELPKMISEGFSGIFKGATGIFENAKDGVKKFIRWNWGEN